MELSRIKAAYGGIGIQQIRIEILIRDGTGLLKNSD